jgi:hypothetical protein
MCVVSAAPQNTQIFVVDVHKNEEEKKVSQLIDMRFALFFTEHLSVCINNKEERTTTVVC